MSHNSLKKIQSKHDTEKITRSSHHISENKSSTSRKNNITNPLNQKKKEFLAVQGVYFTCPLIGPEILTKIEWKDRIKAFLKQQLEKEKSSASCLMIHSLNHISDSQKCVEKLCSIINNIILHPKEEKYKKLRVMNKVFQDNIAKVVGAVEFLESVGFMKKEKEDYYIFPFKNPDIFHLQRMVDLLCNTQAITLELYRNVKVLKPTQVLGNIELPDEFYIRTPEDIKREQQRRTESLENAMQLKTKDMREKDKIKSINNYRYTLIRVRFPDSLCLQATFGVFEQLGIVRNFIRECVTIASFSLITPLGIPLPESKDEKTLLELKLVPAVLLTFASTKAPKAGHHFLIPELCKSF